METNKAWQILLADTSQEFAASVQEMLVKAGYVCDVFISVFDALRKLGEKHYDLIITNIVLSRMKGYEFIKTVQNRGITTPIILIAEEKSLDSLGYYYIKNGIIEIFKIVIMPFNPEYFLEVVCKSLTSTKPGQRLSPEQKMRFRRMRQICEENNIKGVIASPGQGLPPEEMAVELWKHGYIPFPTPEALLTEFEKTMHDGPEGIMRQKASYVHAWKFAFVVSHPNGHPVHPDSVNELERVISAWVEEQGLEIVQDISVEPAPLVEPVVDDDE